MAKKTEPRLVLLRDIVIPAGTVLDRAADERGGWASVECVVGLGKDACGYLVVPADIDRDAEGWVAPA